MRISDWSSDVCSSDLIARDRIVEIGQDRGIGFGQRAETVFQLLCNFVLVDVWGVADQREAQLLLDFLERAQPVVERFAQNHQPPGKSDAGKQGNDEIDREIGGDW